MIEWGTKSPSSPMALRHGICKSVPELAILDWIMLGLDGAQLCRRVREM